eukprot:scaffold7892_cov62-Phaeocystis_antarctica.AAC.6
MCTNSWESEAPPQRTCVHKPLGGGGVRGLTPKVKEDVHTLGGPRGGPTATPKDVYTLLGDSGD